MQGTRIPREHTHQGNMPLPEHDQCSLRACSPHKSSKVDAPSETSAAYPSCSWPFRTCRTGSRQGHPPFFRPLLEVMACENHQQFHQLRTKHNQITMPDDPPSMRFLHSRVLRIEVPRVTPRTFALRAKVGHPAQMGSQLSACRCGWFHYRRNKPYRAPAGQCARVNHVLSITYVR